MPLQNLPCHPRLPEIHFVNISSMGLLASHGGSVAREEEERGTALYYFCSSPTDPWVSKFVRF